jgi:hypothetical protein
MPLPEKIGKYEMGANKLIAGPRPHGDELTVLCNNTPLMELKRLIVNANVLRSVELIIANDGL